MPFGEVVHIHPSSTALLQALVPPPILYIYICFRFHISPVTGDMRGRHFPPGTMAHWRVSRPPASTQRYKDTETQRHRDTQTQRHTDTETDTSTGPSCVREMIGNLGKRLAREPGPGLQSTRGKLVSIFTTFIVGFTQLVTCRSSR